MGNCFADKVSNNAWQNSNAKQIKNVTKNYDNDNAIY